MEGWRIGAARTVSPLPVVMEMDGECQRFGFLSRLPSRGEGIRLSVAKWLKCLAANLQIFIYSILLHILCFKMEFSQSAHLYFISFFLDYREINFEFLNFIDLYKDDEWAKLLGVNGKGLLSDEKCWSGVAWSKSNVSRVAKNMDLKGALFGLKLDHNSISIEYFSVTVSDNGQPSLSSTTRVVVTVTDDNDHSPVFTEQLYRVRIPAMLRQDADVSLFQVVAFDTDTGANADIDYTIKSGKGNGRFKINPKTGMVYTQKNFTAGNKYELQIEAEDNGRPRRSAHTRVLVEVIERQMTSQFPPVVHAVNAPIPINEGQNAVHVTMVQADDPDGDKLWYSITDSFEIFCYTKMKTNLVLAVLEYI
uniref:Cadherin domain-containing protein n=1 Tax=Strigamia maritima TaxID=126957 RepID=T1JL01_STRMM